MIHKLKSLLISSFLIFILITSLPLYAETRRVALLPLAFYGDETKTYLQQGVNSMLRSRISGADIEPIDSGVTAERGADAPSRVGIGNPAAGPTELRVVAPVGMAQLVGSIPVAVAAIEVPTPRT